MFSEVKAILSKDETELYDSLFSDKECSQGTIMSNALKHHLISRELYDSLFSDKECSQGTIMSNAFKHHLISRGLALVI